MNIFCRITKNVSIFATIALLFSGSAHAYVDPGTGSMAVQFFIGGLVAAGFVLKTYYYNIKNRLASLMGRSTTNISSGAESSGSNDLGQTDKPS